MPNFYYHNASGQKIGPVNEQQLHALVAQGVIGPQTPLETDTGHKGQAGQIPGLFPMPAAQQPFQPQPMPLQPQPMPPYQPAPPTGSGTMTPVVLGCIGLVAWLIPLFGFPITIIGLVLGIRRKSTAGIILCIIGLVLTIINSAIGAYKGAQGTLFTSSHQSEQNFVQVQQLERDHELIKLESDVEVAVTFYHFGTVKSYNFSTYETSMSNQGIYVNSWSELQKYIDANKRQAEEKRISRQGAV